MALNTRMRPSTGTPNDGSRTITIRDSQPREEGDEGAGAGDVNADGVDHTERNGRDIGVLRLRGGPSNQPRVSWKEDVVDNEGMGKKKSKICCIYHKPRRFDESSSESSDSSSGNDDSGPDSDSDSGRAQPGGRLRNHRHNHGHNHNHNHSRRSHHDHRDCGDEHAEGGSTRSTSRNGGGGGGVVETIDPDNPDVNAYEKQPKSRKGKAVEH